MPACVVENQQDASAFLLGNLGSHRVDECLENFRIAMRDDEADKLPVRRVDGANDIPSQVTAVVCLHGTRATFHPFLAGPGVALETGFVAKKDIAAGIGEQIEQLINKAFTLDFPCLTIGWLGHATGDFSRVAVLVEIAIEGAVGDVDLLFLAEVAAEFGESPVGLTCEGRIVDEREDDFGDDVGFEFSAPAASGTVDESVDAEFVET